MEHVERIRKQLRSEAKERPLELHCAALDEDKNPKISKPNECFLFSFLIYVLFVGRSGLPNRTFSQCLKAVMRLNNKKATAKKNAVGCLLGFILWIFVMASSLLPLILVLMVSYMFIAWPHVARGSQEL